MEENVIYDVLTRRDNEKSSLIRTVVQAEMIGTISKVMITCPNGNGS